MQSQSSGLRLVAVSGLVCIFLFAACESDADRIREINEADRATQAASNAPAPTPTPLSAEIEAMEVQDGDCINSTIEERVTIETIVIVPCSGSWEYRVLGSFTVDDSKDYPIEDLFLGLAFERCDRRFTFILRPTSESWAVGDRTLHCLQRSLGLSASDPAKLDRMIGRGLLNAGECFNEAPETGGPMVELVDCSGDWEYRVLSSFAASDSPNYPSEYHFSLLADEQCDRRSVDFLHPPSVSWALGDRTVRCLQPSFGLAASDPAKLDRLAGPYRLDTGECFNEAPETGGLMVELIGCSGDWEYRVLSSFTVADAPNYPGEDHLDLLAGEQCDRRFTYFLYPTRELWAVGYRTISCIQESFGLTASDPAKLDRLVDLNSLDAGECYNEAPETDGLMVELVDCSGDWEEQVVNIFSVSEDSGFPGDAYFQDQADQYCHTPWEYYYSPNIWSWEWGDRKVICVRTP